MSFYSDLADIGASVLAEYGQPMNVRKMSSGDYDPATGAPSITYADFPCYGFIYDYTEREINGTSVLVGDRRIILSPPGIDVLAGDLIVFGNAEYKVVMPKPVNPAGETVIIDVQVRR